MLPIACEAGLAPPAAIAALVLALLAAPQLLSTATYLMTEIPTLLLTTAATWMFVRAVRSGRGRPAALAGLLFGLAALCRPAFLYLPALLAVPLLTTAPRMRQAALLLAGAAAAVLPWVVRNAVVLGHPALTFGYAGHTLAQRISFDRMSGRDYALAFPCWLPDGNDLGRLIAGAGACARFGWDETRRHVLRDRHAPAGAALHRSRRRPRPPDPLSSRPRDLAASRLASRDHAAAGAARPLDRALVGVRSRDRDGGGTGARDPPA